MTAPRWRVPLLLFVAVALLIPIPFLVNDYYLSLGISLLNYSILATAWALFSGPTRYISLSTVAFFGIGAYTVAVLNEALSVPLVLLAVVLIAAVLAALVGLSTLRLSGVYFVIFTFGLAELIRQLVTWFEVNVTRSLGRYIFVEYGSNVIYWQLLGLALVVLLGGWFIKRSRFGLALRMVGDDEAVARHTGVETTRVKVLMFILASVVMALCGAIMAPRWVYLDPVIAFNPTLSFEVVIMALLGGANSLFGPLLGAVPLVLLFETITANFPNTFSILLGLVFIGIVYFLPAGVLGLVDAVRLRRQRRDGSGRPALDTATAAAVAPVAATAAAGAAGVGGIPSGAADAAGGSAAALEPPDSAAGEPLLQVHGLRRTFGGLVAVQDLDLELRRGEIVGLIGPNGSGKTTALNVISGALTPTEGQVLLRGRSIGGQAPERIADAGIARTFQLVRVFGSISCLENVEAALAFRPQPLYGARAEAEAARLLARVGLAGQEASPAARLTYIDQKRLELARALGQDPSVLLLDEWLAGLNPAELGIGVDLLRSLRGEGFTLLMVEHVMDAIRALCDRCVVMSAGEVIASGATDEVLADPAVVEAYLGVDDARDA